MFELTYSHQLNNFTVEEPYTFEVMEKKKTDSVVLKSHKFPLDVLYSNPDELVDYTYAQLIHYYDGDFKRVVFFYLDKIIIYRVTKNEVKIFHTHHLEDFVIKNIKLADNSWIYALQEHKENSM